MAIIICKSCGKKVSDTTKTCIHCGTPLLTEEDTNATPILERQRDKEKLNASSTPKNMINFDSLGKSQKEELVHEFWKEDKAAKRFQKRKLIMDYLANGFDFFLLVALGVFLIINLVFKLKAQDTEMFVIALLFLVFVYATLFLRSVLFSIIGKRIVNRKIKRLAYEKRFQAWARDTKQIAYFPVFIDKKDERMYEQINIATYKL